MTIGDLLVELVKARDAALATEEPTHRQLAAIDVVRDAMFVMHRLLGEDLLRAALGTVDGADRVAVLETVAHRIHALSGVFGKMPEDAAAPFKVVEEAIAVARGDAPLLFARVTGHKVNHRIIQAKFEALKWEAYLKGRGLPAGERQGLVERAFGNEGSTWGTIRKSWRRDIHRWLDSSNVDYLLALAESEGRRGEPRWEMLGSSDWQAALTADGERFKQVQRDNIGNR